MTSGPSRLHQGDCIHLDGEASSTPELFQVIAIDPCRDRCWLRRWPLARQGSPVFEMSLRQVQARRAPRHLPGSLPPQGLGESLG
ncbi:MAG: hypothetical protein VKK62_03005 [Synechococcaceae cyanobacterium]|nr:hypothetical protein [Synechococcaceae cyanobacterium]